MKAKNASFSSVLASSSTGNLVAADPCLEDSGLLLRSLWVPELEPKMFSVGQRGTKRNRVELGSALDRPPPCPTPALGEIILSVLVTLVQGHVYTFLMSTLGVYSR